jgi:hypothetical protein
MIISHFQLKTKVWTAKMRADVEAFIPGWHNTRSACRFIDWRDSRLNGVRYRLRFASGCGGSDGSE